MSKPAESTAIHEARWPCDLEAARALLRNYEQHLRSGGAGKAHIHVEGYDWELAELPKYWGGPDAALLLAWREGQAAGCAAVHVLPYRPGACELKRMWVEPAARGSGLGRMLVHAAVAWAKEHGAAELLLDTAPEAMPGAHRLYTSMGFVPMVRYNDNPVPGIVFLRLALASSAA